MEYGQVLGNIPEWLDLGPPMEVGGLMVREVVGEYDRNECDRLPKYVSEYHGAGNVVHGFDKSETRPPIKQTRPGKSIAELKGIHSGACALLFNGPSLANHDLHKITLPMVGMNRTHVGFPGYSGPQPDYLCIVDWDWLTRPKWRESVLRHPCIINGSDHKEDIGYRVTRHPRMAPFSRDLIRDGYVGPVPATTGHFALQFAVFLGFTTLLCLGWDLGGKHFDGSVGSRHFRDALRYHRNQSQVLKDNGINVYITGSPDSAIDFYPHVPFSAACAPKPEAVCA